MHGRVLLFSVDPDVRWLGIRSLTGLGLDVEHADTWEKAQQSLDGGAYDLFLFGPDHFALPKVDKVVQHLLRVQPKVGPVFITANKTEHYIPLLRQYPQLCHVVARSPSLTPRDFCVLATKLLGGEILGIEPYLGPRMLVHEVVIDDSRAKNDYIGKAIAVAQSLTQDGAALTAIETIIDELTMNALYDAPHDGGKPRFVHLARDQPVTLSKEESARLRFGCDGQRFVMSVADPFGALSPGTLLQHIEARLAGISEPINESGGGGFGLFTAYQNSSSFVVNVVPGRCSEVIASIDLQHPFHETRRQPKSLHLFTTER